MLKDLDNLAEVTLSISAKKSWNLVDYNEVIKKSKLKNFSKYKIFNKHDLLKNINRYFDNNLSKFIKNIENSNQKDMFFEIMMIRFDLLQKHRKGVLSIFDSFKSKPQDFIFLLPKFIDSIKKMADFAKISLNGIKGNLKIKSLLIVYFSSFLIWINDDGPLEKTMTSIDLYLDRANNLVNIFTD